MIHNHGRTARFILYDHVRAPRVMTTPYRTDDLGETRSDSVGDETREVPTRYVTSHAGVNGRLVAVTITGRSGEGK